MGRGKRLFSSPKRPDPLWGPPSHVLNVYPWKKRPVPHVPPSDAEVKKEWSYIYAPIFFQDVDREKSSKDRTITIFFFQIERYLFFGSIAGLHFADNFYQAKFSELAVH
jgi:hypothetical protein